MKIRSARLMRLGGKLAARYVRTALATSKVYETAEDVNFHPAAGGADRSYVYVTWHENLLLAAWGCSRFPDFYTLASDSHDGELATGFTDAMGLETVRGSSTRGGARALKQFLDFAKSQQRFRMAIVPDGPQGPRRQMKPGAVYVASRCGLPIMGVGIACERAWRANSWDRMQIPKPFGRVHLYFTAPIWPPTDLGRGGLEQFAALLEAETNRAQTMAEAQAGAEVKPPPGLSAAPLKGSPEPVAAA
jgi:hypothetical protein